MALAVMAALSGLALYVFGSRQWDFLDYCVKKSDCGDNDQIKGNLTWGLQNGEG